MPGRGAPKLLGCMRNPRICVNAMCCPHCMVGRQCSAIEGQNNTMSIPHCLGSCFAFPICVCCIRKKTAEKYNTGEGCCGQVITSYFCGCCSLVQTHKLLKRNGANPGLVLKPPSVRAMDGPTKAKWQEDRNKRRSERAERNKARRGKRKGHGSDSSSESDSSDSD